MMEDKINQVAEDLDTCKTEVGREMQAMRKEMDLIKKDIGELLAIFRAYKGFVRVMYWLGSTIKWIAMVAAPILGIYYFIKTGVWHK
jgi:hypothetical protein